MAAITLRARSCVLNIPSTSKTNIICSYVKTYVQLVVTISPYTKVQNPINDCVFYCCQS